MKISIAIIVAACLYACSPATTENTATADSTIVEVDTIALEASMADDAPVEEDASMYDADPGDVPGRLDGDEYEIFNHPGLVSDPFDFSLDSASLMDLLGEETVITSIITEGGEDEEGAYEGYTFYRLQNDKTKMSFYSYSGKHTADIYTDKLTVAGGIAVGMKLEDFITLMGLPGEARAATSFTINDDYGYMSFYFDNEENLTSITVHYEEGT